MGRRAGALMFRHCGAASAHEKGRRSALDLLAQRPKERPPP